MPAIESLQTALGALRRSPVLFLAGFLAAAVLVPQQATQLLGVPLLPTALQILTFFVTPFLLAGLLGMADEARAGVTSLSTLSAVGRDRYVSVLLGSLVDLAIAIAFGVVAAIAVLVVGVAVLGTGVVAGGPDRSGVSLAGLFAGVVVLALIALAYLAVTFLIQFFAVAIVVEERGPIEGFTRSYRVVRENLLSTLGYSVVNVVVALVTSAPVTGFVLVRTLASVPQVPEGGAPAGGVPAVLFSPVEVAAIVTLSLLVSTLLVTFQRTYAVAFFRRHAREEPNSGVGALGPDDLDGVA